MNQTERFCTWCGARLTPGKSICDYCGAPVDESPGTPFAPPPMMDMEMRPEPPPSLVEEEIQPETPPLASYTPASPAFAGSQAAESTGRRRIGFWLGLALAVVVVVCLCLVILVAMWLF